MSVNLYLNNKVFEFHGFNSERYKDNSGDHMTLNGMHVFCDKGRPYLMWSEDAVVPDEIKDLVEEISCYKTIPQMGRRESGIYQHESAECELTPEDHGNAKRDKPMYMLKIKATNMEDLRKIVHMIKTGTIRPKESYEGSQSGLSRKELEEIALQRDRLLGLLNSMNADANRLERELEEVREALRLSNATLRTHEQNFNNAREKNARLRQLAQSMKNVSLLPLVSKMTVAEQIEAILDE